MSQNKHKKIAKKKAKVKAKRKQANLLKNTNPTNRLINNGLKSPIYECVINKAEIDTGMMNLFVTRKIKADEVVTAAFLIDTFCLGVKDCFVRTMFIEQYHRNKAKRPFEDIKPEEAKKLLIDVVLWSRQIGFQPHKDYKNTIKILKDINEADSRGEFDFGKDGKPMFMPGPNDSPEKCRKILNILANQ